ncbi:MAG: hypothetical protein K2J95_08355 [Lachnospiraceae bacterium]|nr:hypothetical protein [Lachnospiraceae bacterium]
MNEKVIPLLEEDFRVVCVSYDGFDELLICYPERWQRKSKNAAKYKINKIDNERRRK